jgi:outer membrane protein TolC
MLLLGAAPARAGLRIEDAVAFALNRNERAKISDLNVTIADAAVDKARTAFFPTLVSNGTYTQRPDDLVPAPKNSYSLTQGVTLSQPILNASAFPLYAQSKRLLDGQVAQTIDDKRLLAFDAARAFFAVLQAQAIVDAAQQRLTTAKDDLDDTTARVQGGFVSINDETRARIDYANAITEVENDKGTLASARVNLEFTINSRVDGALDPPTALLAAGRAPPPSPDLLVRNAVAARPDLASKRYLATAAHDFAEEPLMRLVPTLGLAGTISVSSDNQAITPGHTFYNNEFLTATLTWPIFDAGVRYADRRSRVATAAIADLTVDTTVRQVDQQVRAALATLVAAQAALVSAEQARDAAKQSVGETAVLYKQGLIKAIELVDANDTRFLADVTYAIAEYGVAVAFLDLRQALGLSPIGMGLL